MKDFKELNKWRDILCSWIGRLHIFEMSYLPNWISRFNEIPIKIPASYFVVNDKVILKFICREKRPGTANIILKTKLEDWHYLTSRPTVKLQ